MRRCGRCGRRLPALLGSTEIKPTGPPDHCGACLRELAAAVDEVGTRMFMLAMMVVLHGEAAFRAAWEGRSR